PLGTVQLHFGAGSVPGPGMPLSEPHQIGPAGSGSPARVRWLWTFPPSSVVVSIGALTERVFVSVPDDLLKFAITVWSIPSSGMSHVFPGPQGSVSGGDGPHESKFQLSAAFAVSVTLPPL